MTYDQNNVFAKILRGEISCDKVYEDEHVLAFHDLHPKRPVHILVIPKGPYKDVRSFGDNAPDVELAAFMRALPKVAEAVGVKENGFRLVVNTDKHGNQEVPHLHFHILGGEALGPMTK